MWNVALSYRHRLVISSEPNIHHYSEVTWIPWCRSQSTGILTVCLTVKANNKWHNNKCPFNVKVIHRFLQRASFSENVSMSWRHHDFAFIDIAVHITAFTLQRLLLLLTPFKQQFINFQRLHQLCIMSIKVLIFSCDQAALWMVFSGRLAVCHTFLTMFPSSYHHEIFRSYHQGPE